MRFLWFFPEDVAIGDRKSFRGNDSRLDDRGWVKAFAGDLSMDGRQSRAYGLGTLLAEQAGSEDESSHGGCGQG
jgi:hypothetical protein